MIERCASIEQSGWLSLREALWPHCSRAKHLSEMSSFIADPARNAQFVAYADTGQAVGFVEASVRTDYVNGAETSPVAFLEGIYVVPESRRRGIAASLVATVAEWAASVGCREIASDASLENHASHKVHRALGFQETERVVFFHKATRDNDAYNRTRRDALFFLGERRWRRAAQLRRWASRRCGVHFRPTAATRMQANCQPGLIGLCAY